MLEIHGLTHRYRHGNALALNDVSLSAHRGEILGLLGPNGAGKSTLVAHIGGLIRPTHGSIRMNGQTLAQARRIDPTRIAIAPQEFAFYPALSVIENLQCFARVNRLSWATARAAVQRALQLGRIEDHASVLAARLSGGYRRRLNFAIALLARPDLIVLDEPTVGVDPETRAFLIEAVRTLATEGAAVIYTSHYMEEIEAIADRVAILHQGRLLRQASLDALLAVEPGRITMTLGSPPSTALLEQLGQWGPVRADGTRITLTLSTDAAVAAVVTALETSGAPILALQLGRNRLEDVFMQLTREAECSPP